MLSDPLELTTFNETVFDFLYEFFHRDFVKSRTVLDGTIYIDPQSYKKDEGKELTFWHLTSREQQCQVKVGNRWQTEKKRVFDLRRSERIEWVKQIISNHDHDGVKLFYHQESNSKRDIRLYLWAYDDDFVVILQKLGKSSSFLVTSFYIDHHKKRRDYEQRFKTYINAEDSALIGCEWF